MEQFEQWAASAERGVVAYFHPGFDYDARVTKGWLMTRLDSALLILGAYLVLVLVGLVLRAFSSPASKVAVDKAKKEPTVAESFSAEPIKYLIVVYNATQVVLCAWMAGAALFEAYKQGLSFACNPFNAGSSAIATVEWVFYLSKILDFMDTFFIVARGKWDQFSFLHIYHHSTIFFIYWFLTVAAYDGDIFYTIVANSTVHFFMYLYYLLSSFNIRPSWGKNLTQFQMIQFITMNAQAIYSIYFACPYPQLVTKVYLAYIITLFALFMQFYLKRWSGGGKGKSKGGKGASAGGAKAE